MGKKDPLGPLITEQNGFDPIAFAQKHHFEKGKNVEKEWLSKAVPSGKQEVIVLVGPPAAGKTTFAHTYFVSKGYVYVNQDTLKTRPACLKLAEASLKEGKSVIIGNYSLFCCYELFV